jgi:serine/threonine protein kinase
MSFDPAQFQGRPLAEMMAALARADAAEVWAGWQGKVELYGPDGSLTEPALSRPGLLMSTLAEAQLPADHPSVHVPGVALESFLGGGGQGWVYAARVLATGRIIAVKVLRSEYVAAQGLAAREALLCARLHHRNILRVFQAQPAGEFWVILMELVQGPELDTEALTPAAFRACFAQLADALGTLAQMRIVHRDVKPGNILLRRLDRSPVLVDFGLAVDLGRLPSESPEISGTPFFMAPEAFGDGAPDPSWDAYSLGVTAAVLLHGRDDPYPNLNTLRDAKLSGAFDRWVQSSLDRIEDGEMREWVGGLIEHDGSRRLAALETARQWLAA